MGYDATDVYTVDDEDLIRFDESPDRNPFDCSVAYQRKGVAERLYIEVREVGTPLLMLEYLLRQTNESGFAYTGETVLSITMTVLPRRSTVGI